MVGTVTGEVETGNVVTVSPDGIVTCAGTVTIEGLPLSRVIVAPTAGAQSFKVILAVAVAPPTKYLPPSKNSAIRPNSSRATG